MVCRNGIGVALEDLTVTEPTKEQIKRLEQLYKYKATCDGAADDWAPCLRALLDAYDERGREVERLRADNAAMFKSLDEQTTNALVATSKWQQAEERLAKVKECCTEARHGELSQPEEPDAHGCTHEETCGFCRARKAEVERLRAERDEARATKDMHKERQEEEIGLRLQAEERLAKVAEIVTDHLDAWPSLRLPLLAALAAAQPEDPVKRLKEDLSQFRRGNSYDPSDPPAAEPEEKS